MSNKELLAKAAAGKRAAEWVEDGMTVGLGTGSTAAMFIAALGKRCLEGLRIQAVATSQASAAQAVAAGIPLIAPDFLLVVDLTVDGADEVDPQHRMIKGRGGALLREKIIASMSREMVVIIDESKQVEQLGLGVLPVEIVPFGHSATLAQLGMLGCQGAIRQTDKGAPYVTDNHNYIADLTVPPALDIVYLDRALHAIPGVVETGFFFNLAGRIVVGYDDGHVNVLSPK